MTILDSNGLARCFELPIFLDIEVRGTETRLVLEPGRWSTWRTRWVTFPTADALDLLADQDVVAASYPTTRNVPNLLRNAVLAVRMLLRERPDVIVSSGAGVAVPSTAWSICLPRSENSTREPTWCARSMPASGST